VGYYCINCQECICLWTFHSPIVCSFFFFFCLYIICRQLLMDVPQCSLVCAEINLNTLPHGYIERSDFFSRPYIYLLQTDYASYLVHLIWVINICIACFAWTCIMSVQDISGRSHILTFSYDVSYRCVFSALAWLTPSWFFSILKQGLSPFYPHTHRHHRNSKQRRYWFRSCTLFWCVTSIIMIHSFM
jgi:hypothetical protein